MDTEVGLAAWAGGFCGVNGLMCEKNEEEYAIIEVRQEGYINETG